MLPEGEMWLFVCLFIIIGIAVGVLLLILGARRARHFLFLVLVFTITFPFQWGLLPHWVTFIFMAFIALAFLQILVTFILGEKAASSMAGNLAADLVRLLLKMLIFPIHIVRKLFVNLLNR